MEHTDLEQEVNPELKEDAQNSADSLNLEEVDAHAVQEKLLHENRKRETENDIEFLEKRHSSLEESRKNYIDTYRNFLKAKRENASNDTLAYIQQQLDNDRRSYLDSKNNYAEALVEIKKSNLTNDSLKSEEEIQTEIENYIRTEIFHRLVIEEEERLQAEKADSYPPKETGVIRKLYNYWDNLGTVQKTLVTTAIATGIAFTSAATSKEGAPSGIETAGVALFFAKKFVSSLAQDVFSGFVGLGVNNILTKKIENSHSSNVEELKKESTLNNLDIMTQKYHDLLEKKATKGSAALVASLLSAFASGKAFDIGMDFLKNATMLGNFTTQTTVTLENTTDVMDRVGATETITKVSSKFFKTIYKLFKINNK